MPDSFVKNLCRCLLCGLLPVFNVMAEPPLSAATPSMAFLEYLGGVENTVDGRLSSPLELDLEALLITQSGSSDERNGRNDTDKVKAGNVTSSEESGNE